MKRVYIILSIITLVFCQTTIAAKWADTPSGNDCVIKEVIIKGDIFMSTLLAKKIKI